MTSEHSPIGDLKMSRPMKVIDFSPVLPGKFYCADVPAENLKDRPLYLEAEFGPGFKLDSHYHPDQVERYQVLSGTLDVMVDKQWHRLDAGQSLDIPAGKAHAARNSNEETIRVVNTLTPGSRTQEFLEAIERLIQEGKVTSATGLKSAIYASLLWMQFRDVTISSRPPDFAIRILARVGGLLGYRV
jgi:mannose-6-phosphate isomerase-like protein (cupin superfamily)